MRHGAGHLVKGACFLRGKPSATGRSVGKKHRFRHFRLCPTATIQQFLNTNANFLRHPASFFPPIHTGHHVTSCTCIRCQRRNHVQADQGSDMAGGGLVTTKMENHQIDFGFFGDITGGSSLRGKQSRRTVIYPKKTGIKLKSASIRGELSKMRPAQQRTYMKIWCHCET